MIINNSYTDQYFSRFNSRQSIEKREMRFFVSSTFADMHEERDAIDKIFKSLRLEASQRNVSLSKVDLRWGVTEEESRLGMILSVCLKEIEHCHPFFIGLLGSCYGTSPNLSELEKNPVLEECYPWLRDDMINGLSITEIEMQYGVLRSPVEVNAAFFFKKDLNGSQSDDSDKLTRLKNQIKQQNRFSKKEYTSIEDLSHKVEATVRAMLDKLFPEEKLDRLGQERLVHKAYLNTYHNHYQRQQTDFNRLDEFLKGDETHLVITGKNGTGKSALIANWLKAKELEKEQLPYNIIYHFVGNSFSDSSYHHILQHLCDEIYDLYGLERQENHKEDLMNETQRILLKAGQIGKPLLIVLDGVDKVIGPYDSKQLYWLPQAPQTTKYLFSTVDQGPTMNAFNQLGYSMHTIGVLDRQLREQFIVDYLQDVGKKLNQSQVDRILDDPENENMLVLKTLLDELICFSSRTQLDSCINGYLSAPSIEDFFNRMLQRMENDYHDVPCILSLIALSEKGMTEEELQLISKSPVLNFHLFYCALYNHIVTRDGLITFAHQYIINAVWKRFGLDNPNNARPYRIQIIDHLTNGENQKNRITELAYQYFNTDNDEQLYKTIMSLDALKEFLSTEQNRALLARYWRKLLKSSEQYQLRNYLDLHADNVDKIGLQYVSLGRFIMEYLGDHETALMFFQNPIEMIGVIPGTNDNGLLSDCYNNAGAVYDKQCNYSKALEYYKRALTFSEKASGIENAFTAIIYENIGGVYYSRCDYSKAMEYYTKALHIREKIQEEGIPLIANIYNNFGNVYQAQGEYVKALECYLEGLHNCKHVLGSEHQDVALYYNNIGHLYLTQGDYHIALEYHLKAMNINEKVLGIDHPDTATTYNNLGNVYFMFDTSFSNLVALNCYLKALGIREKILGIEHPDTGVTYNDIGAVYYKMKDYSKALDYYLKALHIREKVLGFVHYQTSMSCNNIGNVYSKLDNPNKALEYYQKAVHIRQLIYGLNHPTIASLYYNIGNVYLTQAHLSKALEYYQKSLEINRHFLGPYHPNVLNTIEAITSIKELMEKYSSFEGLL